ncbi:hypothetical protein B0H14DRAFT_2635254 [Mycena olivaceomarginata]|nr:hypothetical protein B0H14DRAFT_2635254 [Mycena olivaceomarginata]
MDGLNLFHSGFTSPHSFGSRTKSVPHPLSWNVIVAPSLPSLPFLLLLMSRDDPDYSSPFLGAHPFDTDLEETKFYADGPGIYPVQSQGSIALPPHLAASAKANPHIVGWISTQISTIFAFLSTLDGMRLATFVSFFKMPTGSFIFEFQNPTFTLMAIVIIILTGVQTVGQQACIYWGILLLTLLLLKSSTWFPGTTTLPATIETVWDLPHSVTSKYLLVQQGIGFIADVSCEVIASILVNVLIIVLRGV